MSLLSSSPVSGRPTAMLIRQVPTTATGKIAGSRKNPRASPVADATTAHAATTTIPSARPGPDRVRTAAGPAVEGVGPRSVTREMGRRRRRRHRPRPGPVRGLGLACTPASAVAAVGAYGTAMRGYANQALALSTRNADDAALATAFGRCVFRGLLRIGSVVPPLKRMMSGRTVAPDPRHVRAARCALSTPRC